MTFSTPRTNTWKLVPHRRAGDGKALFENLVRTRGTTKTHHRKNETAHEGEMVGTSATVKYVGHLLCTAASTIMKQLILDAVAD